MLGRQRSCAFSLTEMLASSKLKDCSACCSKMSVREAGESQIHLRPSSSLDFPEEDTAPSITLAFGFKGLKRSQGYLDPVSWYVATLAADPVEENRD